MLFRRAMSKITEPTIEASASDPRLARVMRPLFLVAPPVLATASLAAAYFASMRPDMLVAALSLLAWPALIVLGLTAVAGVVEGVLWFWRGSGEWREAYPLWVPVIVLMKLTLGLTSVALAVVAILSLLIGGRAQDAAIFAAVLAWPVTAFLMILGTLVTMLEHIFFSARNRRR